MEKHYEILNLTPMLDVLSSTYTGVQSINNVYAIVNKAENVLANTYIFDLRGHPNMMTNA
jgi:hypothetical protein